MRGKGQTAIEAAPRPFLLLLAGFDICSTRNGKTKGPNPAIPPSSKQPPQLPLGQIRTDRKRSVEETTTSPEQENLRRVIGRANVRAGRERCLWAGFERIKRPAEGSARSGLRVASSPRLYPCRRDCGPCPGGRRRGSRGCAGKGVRGRGERVGGYAGVRCFKGREASEG